MLAPVSRQRVTIGDVATASGSVDRHGVEGDQRPLRRRARHVDAGQGGDRRPRLRGQPRRAQHAQPAHERHRDPRRRHRAVQRRAAQGRGAGDPRHRLRADRLLRQWPRQGALRLGATQRLAPQRHAHRRDHPRHPDGGRRHRRRARGHRRPPRRVGELAERLLRQPGRRGHRHRVPHRARAPPHRVPRRPSRPRIGPAARAGVPRGARRRRHRPRPGAGGCRRVRAGDVGGGRPPAARSSTCRRRRSSPPTTCRRSRRWTWPGRSGCPCPATCR